MAITSIELLYQPMAIGRRAQARPATHRARFSRRTLLRGGIAAGVTAIAGVGAYGFLDERHAVGLTETTVPVSGLPAALSGLRIGLLTDIHRSRWVLDEDVQ